MLFVHKCANESELSVPEGLGVLSAYVQLGGGGGAAGVVLTHGRVPYELRQRNYALCRYLGSCWTTVNKEGKA